MLSRPAFSDSVDLLHNKAAYTTDCRITGIPAKPSKDHYIVSDKQKEFYNKNGFLVISGLIDFGVLYACKQRFLQICSGQMDKGAITVMKEIALMETGATGENLINKIQNIVYDDVFSLYTECAALLDVVQQFIGPDIMAVHSMLINKPPGTTEHPPHQDLHYFPFRPVDKIIASWTAMEEVRRDNGCLYVVPGSHRLDQLYDHSYPASESGVINKAYHGIQDPKAAPECDRVYLEMSPGDTVFFHPLLVHGSPPNLSKNFRKAISCHYAASECHYIDTEGTSQHKLAQEVQNMAKDKFGVDLTFQELWKYKSKLVRGVKCNL